MASFGASAHFFFANSHTPDSVSDARVRPLLVGDVTEKPVDTSGSQSNGILPTEMHQDTLLHLCAGIETHVVCPCSDLTPPIRNQDTKLDTSMYGCSTQKPQNLCLEYAMY